MTMLMRYEFRKTMAVKIIILGLTAAAQAVYMFGLLADQLAGKKTAMVIGALVLFFLALLGICLIGLNSVLTLHRDMNTRQGYMLFMTPNSSYRILGAKVLENGISLLLAAGFFFALGTLDISLLFKHENAAEEMYDLFYRALQTVFPGLEITAGTLLALTASIVSGWIATLAAAYLADVVSAALLNGKRFNGLVSFILFLVLTGLSSWLINKIGNLFHLGFIGQMLQQSGVALVLAAAMYVVTAEIMERKLSV